MSLKLKVAEHFRGTHALRLYRDELSRTQFWPRSRLKELQWSRLQRILRHAYDHTRYYRRVFDERGLKPEGVQSLSDLQQLPLLTKDVIRANYDDLLSDNRRRYRPRIITSGGSTGDPLKFYIDGWTNSYKWADAYRGMIIGGWRPGDRTARVWGTSVLSIRSAYKKRIYAYLNNWYPFPAFHAGEEDMREWARTLRKKRIRAMSGYVDTIVDFARFVIAEGLQTHLVAVFPTTAPLTQSGRRLIEKAFGCGVFDLYQTADGGLSSIECPEHRGLHVSDESCLLEFPEEPGEHEVAAVVTDLFNYAMPFIRYVNGDELLVTDEICPCGRELPLILRVRGKTYHHIRLPNGDRVHSEIFSYYLNSFLLVKRYWAQQVSPTDIVLEIALDPKYMDQMPALERTLPMFSDSLPGMNVEARFVDEIRRLPNEKYEIFVPYQADSLAEGDGDV